MLAEVPRWRAQEVPRAGAQVEQPPFASVGSSLGIGGGGGLRSLLTALGCVLVGHFVWLFLLFLFLPAQKKHVTTWHPPEYRP